MEAIVIEAIYKFEHFNNKSATGIIMLKNDYYEWGKEFFAYSFLALNKEPFSGDSDSYRGFGSLSHLYVLCVPDLGSNLQPGQIIIV